MCKISYTMTQRKDIVMTEEQNKQNEHFELSKIQCLQFIIKN